jgi:hypothetical protein
VASYISELVGSIPLDLWTLSTSRCEHVNSHWSAMPRVNRKLKTERHLGHKSASGKFGASSPLRWQGGDEGKPPGCHRFFLSPSILGNDSVLYHSLSGLASGHSGRLPQTATIRSLVCSREMRPLAFLDPRAFPEICEVNSGERRYGTLLCRRAYAFQSGNCSFDERVVCIRVRCIAVPACAEWLRL